ncbi:MAG: alpha-2-macroglobulin family protein [Pseudomonadota bacterium]
MKLTTIALAILAALFAQITLAAFDSGDFNDQKKLKINRVTPSGEKVRAGRQIIFQFNRPVVPIGKMERKASEIPVDITPKIDCQWRWLNTSSLACQLSYENKLKKATMYSITMNPGIMAEDGATISEAYTNEFITSRPRVRYARVSNWQSPGVPVVRLTFNQSVSKSSVERYVAFTYHKSGADKAYIIDDIKVEKDPSDRQNPRYIVVPGESYVLDFGEGNTSKSDDDPRNIEGEEARRIWLVSPKKELPIDTEIYLNVTPGIVSAHGIETGFEDRTVVNFHTFPEFTFFGIKCRTNDNDLILITAENNDEIGKCNPLKGTALSFSAPVMPSQIKNNVIITPDLAGGKKDYDPWANIHDTAKFHSYYWQGRPYDVWLPERLKANKNYTFKTKQADLSFTDIIKLWVTDVQLSNLEDVFGRKLKKPIDLTFFTDHRAPNFELVHRTAVLEEQIDSDVPLYVTNLDSVTFDYKKLTSDGTKSDQSLNVDVAKAQDVQFAIPMRVREMLGDKSGAVYGTIETQPHVAKHPREHILFASVSPYQLHVKIGHYNTLVWVTDLATGEPIKNARVQIYKDKISNLSDNFKSLDEGKTDISGLVSLKGTHELDPELYLFSWCRGGNQDGCDRLFVRVDKAGEMAIMPLERRFGVNTYRASGNMVKTRTKKKYGHIKTWGTTAQGVYRAGDRIEYKIYVRNQDNETYILPPTKNYILEIIDPTGKKVHEIKDITLSKFGSYSGEYTVPENASVGWYNFKLKGSFTDDYTWRPMRVLVSDFTPAPFKVVNSLNGDIFNPEEEVEVSSIAKLHSGGAYSDAQTRVTARLKAAYFSSKHPVAGGFTFDSYKKRRSKKIFQKTDIINDNGEAIHRFTLPKEDIIFGRLTVESAVRDDRGKYIAANSHADYVAVNRLVGLKHTKWLYEEDKPAQIKYIVVDKQGIPTAATDVKLKIELLQTKAAKVKGAGNAYLTNYIDEWIAAGNCSGTSKVEPLICNFVPQEPGTYKITATIKDTKGNTHSTEIRARVAGKGRIIWRSPNDNSLQIIPEKTEYNIGDKARYLIKNPYPGAKALISIERYGVLKSWVQDLESSTPVIEFEVEKDFMPGFYLSVVTTSPRVEAPPVGMGKIDLGKPAFKMGYVKVPVKDPYKQIDVSIKTAQQIYKPRDIVTATIHAKPKHNDKDEPIEIAVAVLDEAVLDLIKGKETYFDPYEGFYKLDDLDVHNYSLLTRLVGRQKFEKKGANPGGDGGADIAMRSIKKYVSYWNPSITPDKDGNATIKFEVPDNLTGWRILAFAVTPSDRMGLGDTIFKVNRPTEIRPVMPNQVTEGDSFQAGFSVMNRTDTERDITVIIDVEGSVTAIESFSQVIKLAPYKRQTIHVPVTAMKLPYNKTTKTGMITFIATAEDSSDGDGIKHKLVVNKRRSLETAANYGTSLSSSVSESLHFPEKIYPDVGDVSVVLSPSVIGNVDGAFRYIRDYPYTCWEQKLAKAVMASHYQNLRDYLPDDLTWDASQTLPNDMLKQAANHQVPNGGMSYYTARDEYTSPYLSAYTALAFNWLRSSGYDVPKTVESRLHVFLERLLRNDIFPNFYTRGMSSSIRAVALAALAEHGKVSLNDLERYRSHVGYMSLFGKAHYLQAALKIEGADKIRKEVTDMILSSSSQSGGKFAFNEELDDSYARVLATSPRTNCAILSAITQYGEDKAGASLVGDIPFKLVRSITQARGNRDHWQNTQENVFCMNSLIDYSRIYKNLTPNMHVSVTMDKENLGKANFKDLRDDAMTLSRPITKDDPGVKRKVNISKTGDGRIYYATRMRYASLEDHAIRLNAGIDIRKEYSVKRNDKLVLLNNPSEIKRGELVRVDIYVSLPTARNFVVVDDHVPGGLEPVNRDLATTSIVDADQAEFQAAGSSWWFRFDDWRHFNASRWSFYHKELTFNAVRFYSDYLPAGNYHLSYIAQAIAEGEFTKMPVHAEEMYDPDVFGKGLPGTLKVGQ